MLEEIKRATDTVFIWSNKNILAVKTVLNRQNDRIYIRDVKDLPDGSQSHLHPVKQVGVNGMGCSCLQWVQIFFFFIPEGIMINRLIYIEMLES